ncbi:pyruvate formate lyase-activating protein [Candidatus Woesearchaeota archaeon]|nr:pyruvate formate lyase-activating protein [Candidatus Woesearchaeota archaeon]
MLKVHSIETLGTQEGPGIRFLLFLQGCNVRCIYCHNPDTWVIGAGKDYSVKDIVKLVEKQKEYFGDEGGITVSGGEPLVQRKELIGLFKALKKKKIHTALDTNGMIFDEFTVELLKYADLTLLDIKHIDPVWQKKVTGMTSDAPIKIAEHLEKTGKKFWIRYVLVPGYTDKEEFILKTAEFFKDYKCLERLEILPFHTLGKEKYEKLGIDYPCKGISPPSEKAVQKTKKLFERYLKDVYVR